MIYASTAENIHAAAQVLCQGGVVAVPTETVYGLAGSIYHPEAVAEIFRLKGRPQDNPLIVHVSSFEQAFELTTEEGREVIESFGRHLWPGPLTVVVPCSHRVPAAVSAGLDTVALRMPSHAVLRELIAIAAVPLAAPSANISGRPSPTRAEHVLADFGDKLYILDGGPCEHGIESTVVQIVEGTVHILRPGAISAQDLDRLGLGSVKCAYDHDERSVARSPGMKYRHYAPTANLILCYSASEVIEQLRIQPPPTLLLLPPGLERQFPGLAYRPLMASSLFDELRRADSLQTRTIVVLCDDSVCTHEALFNRLRKAAGIDGKGH